jgi:hypothetical protein
LFPTGTSSGICTYHISYSCISSCICLVFPSIRTCMPMFLHHPSPKLPASIGRASGCHLARKSWRKMVRFCVNLSRFLASSDLVTSATHKRTPR